LDYNTSLSYLIVLVFLVSTIMDVVEMLDLYVSWFAIVTDQDLSGASLFSLMFLFGPTVLSVLTTCYFPFYYYCLIHHEHDKSSTHNHHSHTIFGKLCPVRFYCQLQNSGFQIWGR
jgi:hypothetical protein